MNSLSLNDTGVPHREQGTRLSMCREAECALVVHLCIFNSDGQLLIQCKRSSRNVLEKWDLSVNGFVFPGDFSLAVIRKEVTEQLGIHASHRIRFDMCTKTDGVMDEFYIMKKNINLSSLGILTTETREFFWASYEEVYELLLNNEFAPYKLSLLKHLFCMGKC